MSKVLEGNEGVGCTSELIDILERMSIINRFIYSSSIICSRIRDINIDG